MKKFLLILISILLMFTFLPANISQLNARADAPIPTPGLVRAECAKNPNLYPNCPTGGRVDNPASRACTVNSECCTGVCIQAVATITTDANCNGNDACLKALAEARATQMRVHPNIPEWVQDNGDGSFTVVCANSWAGHTYRTTNTTAAVSPTPTVYVPTMTPAPTPTLAPAPFDPSSCTCDGVMDYSSLTSGDSTQITSLAKVAGNDTSKSQVASQKFTLTEGPDSTGTVISSSDQIPASVVSQTTSKVSYKSVWNFTIPQLKLGTVYTITSQISCQPKSAAYNYSHSNVLGTTDARDTVQLDAIHPYTVQQQTCNSITFKSNY